MQLTRLMTSILIVAALATPALADCPKVSTDGQSIWLEEGANKRLVFTDPNGVELPSLFGNRIAYTRERADGTGAVLTEIVVLKDTGEMVRVITVPEETTVNGVLQLGWRDSKRLFIEGHVNPATTLFVEFDAGTGVESAEREGLLFTVSPNGGSVAQRQHVPLGAPEEFDSAVLGVDGQAVYPAADDAQHHNFVAAPVWARDSHRIALVDEVGGATFVVTVSLDGKNVKTTSLHVSLAGSGPRVSWSGDNVIVRTDQDALRIHPQTGTVEAALPGEGNPDSCSN
jgi:hypothetical protein